MSIISLESPEKISDEFFCPIAGSPVMKHPVNMPCCRASMDAQSLTALLRRLPSSANTLPCPLCRWQMVLGDEVDEITGGLVRKVIGVVQNQELKLKIDEWVEKNPDVRRELLISSDFFGAPIESDDEEVNPIPSPLFPSRVPGLLEALSLVPLNGGAPLTFGPEFAVDVEDTDILQARRDFLVTFNMIWQEIPYDLRPEPFTADTQKELQEKVLVWLSTEASKEALFSVETLNLQNLDLLSLPPIATKLPNLTSMDVSKNRLTELPVIPSLNWLNARKNCIKKIDGRVSWMQNLETLYLAKNPIKAVSSKMASLPKLKRLDLMDISPYFQGLPIEFVDFQGKISIDKKHNRRLMEVVTAEVGTMLNAGIHLRLKDFQKVGKTLEQLTPYMRDAIVQNTNLLTGQLQASSSADDRIKIEAVHLTAMFYITWLYWCKNNDAADRLFLRLPLELRNEVYGEVYREIAPKLSSRNLRDPEIGRKIFHCQPGYPETELEARIKAISLVGSQRVEKLKTAKPSLPFNTLSKGGSRL